LTDVIVWRENGVRGFEHGTVERLTESESVLILGRVCDMHQSRGHLAKGQARDCRRAHDEYNVGVSFAHRIAPADEGVLDPLRLEVEELRVAWVALCRGLRLAGLRFPSLLECRPPATLRWQVTFVEHESVDTNTRQLKQPREHHLLAVRAGDV
jgi:hypothetical protein